MTSIGVTSRWSKSLGKWRQLGNDRHLTQSLSHLRSDDRMVEVNFHSHINPASPLYLLSLQTYRFRCKTLLQFCKQLVNVYVTGFNMYSDLKVSSLVKLEFHQSWARSNWPSPLVDSFWNFCLNKSIKIRKEPMSESTFFISIWFKSTTSL